MSVTVLSRGSCVEDTAPLFKTKGGHSSTSIRSVGPGLPSRSGAVSFQALRLVVPAGAHAPHWQSGTDICAAGSGRCRSSRMPSSSRCRTSGRSRSICSSLERPSPLRPPTQMRASPCADGGQSRCRYTGAAVFRVAADRRLCTGTAALSARVQGVGVKMFGGCRARSFIRRSLPM